MGHRAGEGPASECSGLESILWDTDDKRGTCQWVFGAEEHPWDTGDRRRTRQQVLGAAEHPMGHLGHKDLTSGAGEHSWDSGDSGGDRGGTPRGSLTTTEQEVLSSR